MGPINLVEQADTAPSATPARLPQMRGLTPVLAVAGAPNSAALVFDAGALPAELKAKGADLVRPPSDEPCLMRKLQVRDRAGHLPALGHPSSGANNG